MIDIKKISGIRKEMDPELTIFSWQIPRDLPYVDGHFPLMPVVPAIACVDVCLELHRIQNDLAEPAFLQTLKSAKFTGPIQPGDEIRIQVEIEAPQVFKFTWMRLGTRVAEIRLAL